MHRILAKFEGPFYVLLRIVSGLLFLFHGGQKLFGWFGADQVALASQMGLVGAIEFFGGILIMIGLFASWAAFLSSGLMAFAYFMAHFSVDAFWPIQNQGELAVLYCFIFLYIAARGAGPLSVAHAMGKPQWG